MAEQGSDDIITVVLTADNHLGYSAISSSGQHLRRREERLQRLRHAFQRATDFAVGQGVDLFIQAGDLFDTPNPAEQERSFVAARLAELHQAGIRTFALGGLHDTPVDAGSNMAHEDYMAPQMSYARLGALHYFPPGPSIELEPVMKDVHGVLVGICGLGVLAGQQGDPLAKARVHSEIERAAVSILILHSPIEGLVSQDYDIRDSRVARSTLASQPSFRYILAGYHHRYQHLHIGNTDMIVAGATEHIDWNDPDDEPGFVFLGLAADSMRWCHHMTGNALQLRRLVIRTTELWPEHTPKDTDTEESNTRLPTDIVLEQLRPLCAADSILQLHLVGELTRHQYHQLDVNQIRRYGEEHCFELALDESGLSILPIDSYLALGALSRAQWSAYQSVAPTNPLLQSGSTSEPALSGNEGEASSGERARPLSAAMLEERLSPREELINLADEWIAATDVAPGTSSGEKKALIATKEELLAALDRMKRS